MPASPRERGIAPKEFEALLKGSSLNLERYRGANRFLTYQTAGVNLYLSKGRDHYLYSQLRGHRVYIPLDPEVVGQKIIIVDSSTLEEKLEKRRTVSYSAAVHLEKSLEFKGEFFDDVIIDISPLDQTINISQSDIPKQTYPASLLRNGITFPLVPGEEKGNPKLRLVLKTH